MRTTGHNSWRRLLPLACFCTLLGMTGCGNRLSPVRGKVVYDDGTPMNEGFVICETREGETPIMARGEIQPDGSFRLGTYVPRDGARPGKYRVLVTPRGRTEAEEKVLPPILDPKFQRYDTSGLEFEVKRGSNEFTLTVSKPTNKRRR